MRERKHPFGIFWNVKELKKGTIIYHPVLTDEDPKWKGWGTPPIVHGYHLFRLKITEVHRRDDGVKYLEIGLTKGEALMATRRNGEPILAEWTRGIYHLFKNQWYAISWILHNHD